MTTMKRTSDTVMCEGCEVTGEEHPAVDRLARDARGVQELPGLPRLAGDQEGEPRGERHSGLSDRPASRRVVAADRPGRHVVTSAVQTACACEGGCLTQLLVQRMRRRPALRLGPQVDAGVLENIYARTPLACMTNESISSCFL